MNNRSVGKDKEALGAEYLEKSGYIILEKNFYCSGGEIDIIAMDGNTYVFVEVKYRRTAGYGLPEEAVSPIKQQRIYKAAIIICIRAVREITYYADLMLLPWRAGKSDIIKMHSEAYRGEYMIKIKKAGKRSSTIIVETEAPYIQYKNLKETGIVHNGFSTRLGGVSGGMYSSMNFSVKMGDSIENVRKNFQIFMEKNGFKNPVMSNQTHTTNVLTVTENDIGKGIYKEADYSDIDGLITNRRGITLVTSYADCVPLYFADVKNKAIGLSHSGWRGTVNRMGEATLKRMKEEFGTKPEDVIAAIGPSICLNCYEVSFDVAREFEKEFGASAEEHRAYDTEHIRESAQNMDAILYKKDNGKYLLNLWAANYKVLTDAGVLSDNIAIPDICTCCNRDILFSHRGHMGKRGNLCAFLMLK